MFAVLAVVVSLGSGCSSTPMKVGTQEINAEFAKNPQELLQLLERVEKGMPEAEVYKVLGITDKQANLTYLDATEVQQAMCGSCRFDPKSIEELKAHEDLLSQRVGRRLVITMVNKYVFIRNTSVVELKKGVDMGIVMVFQEKKLILMRPNGNPNLESSEAATLFGIIYGLMINKGLAGVLLLR
ncbi:MAG: hypothetical protein A3D65_03625 [Candidatus Lloydbacteria bacterium RIFCSPHIGHO2_02_FULL_50_13]|uniref:Uncharacterized protein n=1 Tax=Candidatus Lloydbacteria bacterium RIFCSPHIGHO2_02_FULL_50_13 TaxID=1798661 RepID=A0A1G2D2M7_9BACT|nr:MAG: hypothetical protein A3D65_03625 [Candidatus Lloydbacteria bacterium RIFCSPHIGHO2_02_FULL_50_13]